VFQRVGQTDQLTICTINLLDAVTLRGAYDGGRESLVGLQGHVICYSGRQACISRRLGYLY